MICFMGVRQSPKPPKRSISISTSIVNIGHTARRNVYNFDSKRAITQLENNIIVLAAQKIDGSTLVFHGWFINWRCSNCRT